ncbi:MAG TPA: iron ABC transporter permease [Bacillota bacterium]
MKSAQLKAESLFMGRSPWKCPFKQAGWKIVPIYLFLIVFVIIPLLKIFVDTIWTTEGQLTFEYVRSFFSDPFYLKAIGNSMLLSFYVVITTTILGFCCAYFLVRYDFWGKRLFSYLSFFPIIMPPLVGVMGFIFILGRSGTVNTILMDYFGLRQPLNFIYGWHGILLVETLHLFPIIAINITDSLGKIDASLEEAAESVGSIGLRRLKDITFPLTTPGYISGALLVFMWTFADFATPLVVGIHDLLATQAYLNIVQFVDRNIFQMGIVIGVFMIFLSIVFLFISNKYLGMKDYAILSYRSVERKRLTGFAGFIVPAFFIVTLGLAFIPYLGVTLAAFGKAWAMTPFPVQYTLNYFTRVIVETPKYIINTFVYCGLAVILCLVLGIPIAWILSRTKMKGRWFLDSLITLILALPGTALGIAYIRAFNSPVFGISLASIWIIMPILLAVRRLSYTVRSTYSSLLVVHVSMEEAARSVGASPWKIFQDITLPLIWKGVLAGALFSFMTSIQESAATILIALPGWETMTVGTFNFYTSGSINEAAALGFILIVVGGITLFVIDRISGMKSGGFFG